MPTTLCVCVFARYLCVSLSRSLRASYCIAPAASRDVHSCARHSICDMRPACVCGTFRCIAGPSSRATSAGCMLLGISGCLLSVSLRRRANSHVSRDAACSQRHVHSHLAAMPSLTGTLASTLAVVHHTANPPRLRETTPTMSRLQAAVPVAALSFVRATAPKGLEGLPSGLPCHSAAIDLYTTTPAKSAACAPFPNAFVLRRRD